MTKDGAFAAQSSSSFHRNPGSLVLSTGRPDMAVMTDRPDEEANADADPRQLSTSRKALRVLVVDDDDLFRLAVGTLLETGPAAERHRRGGRRPTSSRGSDRALSGRRPDGPRYAGHGWARGDNPDCRKQCRPTGDRSDRLRTILGRSNARTRPAPSVICLNPTSPTSAGSSLPSAAVSLVELTVSA